MKKNHLYRLKVLISVAKVVNFGSLSVIMQGNLNFLKFLLSIKKRSCPVGQSCSAESIQPGMRQRT